MCEFRAANDSVTDRLYSRGQSIGNTAYYYTRGHLGSVRELAKSGGSTLGARYDYDSYGRSTTALGTTPTDVNFTGLYRHSKSNLDLATYRPYDPDLGRWLSRDPIGETGGINLYGYVGNNPVNATDPLGLWAYFQPSTWFDGKGYQPGVVENDISEAAQATLDGIIPFADPFGDNGGYDECDPSLQFSRSAAQFARDVYTGRLLLGGAARLGASRWPGTRWINSNRYLRFGESGQPPRLTVRVGQARPPTRWNHIPIE